MEPQKIRSSINSCLGVLRHYKSIKIQRDLINGFLVPWRYGYFVKCVQGYKYVL